MPGTAAENSYCPDALHVAKWQQIKSLNIGMQNISSQLNGTKCIHIS